MRIFYVAAECKPFSKRGGVADVAGELPIAVKNASGAPDIEIVTPFYGAANIADEPELTHRYDINFHGKNEHIEVYVGQLHGVPVNFVKNKTYFEGDYAQPYIHSEKIPFQDDILRFSFFSEACLELIKIGNPDIVHINDWVLGYLFGRMAMAGLPQKRVLTVHNIGYQGNIGKQTIKGWDIEKILRHKIVGKSFVDPRVAWRSVNALRLGLELADIVNTVSPNYRREITQPEDQARYFEGGKGLHKIAKALHEQKKLIGIVNGYEYAFEPTDDKFAQVLQEKSRMKTLLSQDFANPDNFLLGFVGRAVEQKFKLLTEVIGGKSVLRHLLDIPGINIAILATGLPEYEKFMREFIDYPNYSATVAFDKEKAKQICLGSDVFLMPSLFEPCGITQMESLSSATPPLVRWTGGLMDTVRPHTSSDGTGFGFDGDSKNAILRNLIKSVKDALSFYSNQKTAFKELQRRAFNERFLWETAARRYIDEIYVPALNNKR